MLTEVLFKFLRDVAELVALTVMCQGHDLIIVEILLQIFHSRFRNNFLVCVSKKDFVLQSVGTLSNILKMVRKQFPGTVEMVVDFCPVVYI